MESTLFVKLSVGKSEQILNSDLKDPRAQNFLGGIPSYNRRLLVQISTTYNQLSETLQSEEHSLKD